jgi:hypothetical protein
MLVLNIIGGESNCHFQDEFEIFMQTVDAIKEKNTQIYMPLAS